MTVNRYLNIPIPVSEIPKLLKGVDSSAGIRFKELVLEEVTKALEKITSKEKG